MRRTAEELFGEGWAWEGVPVAGRLDPHIFHEAARRNGLADAHDHHDRFRDRYLACLEEELSARAERVRAMPGVAETLGLLRDRRARRGDVVLGLLTGNYSSAGPMKVSAAGLEPGWFTVTAYGDEAETRAELVSLAMGKHRESAGWSVAPGCVIVIGDTPQDVGCARANGCVSFAVATGRYSGDELREAGADHVVEDLSDPGALMGVVDGVLGVGVGG